MFSTEIANKFGYSTPIFIKEILNYYKKYSKQYIYRVLKESMKDGNVVSFSRGVYFVPTNTEFGNTDICSDQVVEKRYITSNGDVFGTYSGLYLLNQFGITSLVPNTFEIVTNNESTKRRIIIVDHNEYVIKRSRCKITKANFASYKLLELFNSLDNKDILYSEPIRRIKLFIKDNNIKFNDILKVANYFPSKALKRLVLNKTIYEFLQQC